MEKIKVLVVDDSLMARDAISFRISCQKNMIVAGMAEDGVATLNFLQKNTTDIILLDYKLPDTTGLVLYNQIANHYPEVKVIFHTCMTDLSLLIRLVKLNSGGIVLKDSSFLIEKAINFVFSGRQYLSPEISMELVKYALNQKKADNLTNTEYQVIELYTQGQKNESIAGRLKISPQVVKNMKSRAFSKLETRDIKKIRELL